MNLAIQLITVFIALIILLTFLPTTFVFPFFVAQELRDEPTKVLKSQGITDIAFY